MKNAKSCNSYLEIGCRWGGTFIVTCEVLRRANPNFKYAIAADIIAKTPFIERYSEIIKKDGLEIVYFQGFSTSNDFADLVGKKKPDIAFIDGDHTCIGVLQDHMLVREYSKIIVHHDISSDACSHTTFLWKCLKVLENTRDSIEFTDQYQSVNGRFLGIGVLLANINK
jgi:cephalosporin hydroxylase